MGLFSFLIVHFHHLVFLCSGQLSLFFQGGRGGTPCGLNNTKPDQNTNRSTSVPLVLSNASFAWYLPFHKTQMGFPVFLLLLFDASDVTHTPGLCALLGFPFGDSLALQTLYNPNLLLPTLSFWVSSRS